MSSCSPSLRRPGLSVGLIASTLAALSAMSATAGPFDRLLPKAGPKEPVTTSINDARPIARWLDDAVDGRTPQDVTTFNLTPGYYRMTVRSYCLHAGSYGPTKGDGYLLASLMGSRAGMIKSILERTEQHPDIKQQDVQQLIWDIEAGVKFQDLPQDFAARVAPLLTPGDIADLNIDRAALLDRLLPGQARNALEFYNGLRQKLVDPTASFEDIARIAVPLADDVPWGPGSRKDVKPGNWSYVSDGYFIRSFPENYSTTVLEILKPAPYQLTRDDRGRIIHYQSEGYTTDVTYDDAPGRDAISTPGQPDVHIWRFKTIHITGPDPGEDETLQNTGWVVPDAASSYSSVGAVSWRSASHTRLVRLNDAAPAPVDAAPAGGPTLAEYQARILKNQALFASLRDYVGQGHSRKARFAPDNGGGLLSDSLSSCDDSGFDMGSSKNFSDGMNAATNPQDAKGKRAWIDKNTASTMDGWSQAAASLAGQSSNGNNPLHLPGHVTVPANTSRQRLGLSSFSK